MTTDNNALKQKAAEIAAQQEKLKALQADLAKINSKVENKEQLTKEDTEFLGNLGWLSALSVTIASIASSL